MPSAPAPAPPVVERAVPEPGAGSAAGNAGGSIAEMPVTVAAAGWIRASVSPPDSSVRWEVGAGGRIERQMPGEQPHPEHSGVTADLLAGSSPSARVCWVVGRDGTILLTVDGERWKTISSPTRADLVSVSAGGDRTATVVASDSKRYTTTDGGRTWQAQ